MRVAIVVTAIVLMDFDSAKLPEGVDDRDVPEAIKDEISGDPIAFVKDMQSQMLVTPDAPVVIDTQVVVQKVQ